MRSLIQHIPAEYHYETDLSIGETDNKMKFKLISFHFMIIFFKMLCMSKLYNPSQTANINLTFNVVFRYVK